MTELTRILALCLASALICAALRAAHPQIAAVVALACGVGALMLSLGDLSKLADALRMLGEFTPEKEALSLLKLCGIAIAAEFASDICRDAGEAAIARRIDVGVRIGIVAAALPSAAELMDSIAGLFE